MPEIQVDKELIQKVAKNARLKLSDEELEKFVPEIKEVVVESFNQLDEVFADEEPSFQPIESKNHFREDKAEEGLSQEEALKNVSEKLKEKGYIKGPKVL